jgi:hypothetical protein
MDSRYKNRETLKSYFRKGQVPTEEQFAALIDSLYNVSEDGCLTVSEDDGLKLYPTGNERTVASIYREKPVSPEDRPLWRVTLGDDGSLAVSDGHDGKNILLIGTDGVTVPGELKAGRYTLPDKSREEETPDGFGTLQVKADGRWHDLPVEAAAGRPGSGCRVYRISACYHHPRSGKYSYCEVTASHSDGSRCRLQSVQRHWWGWSGKIKLRWQEHDGKLYLQMRSRRTRRGAEFILCRIEMLWEM